MEMTHVWNLNHPLTKKRRTTQTTDPLAYWDDQWQSLGFLQAANFSPYFREIGLYRYKINGKVKFVGSTVDWLKGGLRRSLSEDCQRFLFAMTFARGLIFLIDFSQIEVEVLIPGTYPHAIDTTESLTQKYLKRDKPLWNRLLY